MKLVIPVTDTSQARSDPALVKLVAQAISLRDRMNGHATGTFNELALALGYGREYAADLLRVSFLAPDILTAILDGRQPAGQMIEATE